MYLESVVLQVNKSKLHQKQCKHSNEIQFNTQRLINNFAKKFCKMEKELLSLPSRFLS